MFESFANHLISAQKVWCGDALSVRGIGDYDALVGWLGEVLEVLLPNGDVVAQTSGLHVKAGRVDGFDIDIISVYMVLKLTLLALVVIDFVEQVGIKVWPFLKSILFAEQSRGHVLGDKGCFDENGARTAHGIDEVRVTFPPRKKNHTGCEHFIERCLDTLLAISATV